MHHRAKKTRRQVRCTLCTPVRWMGNTKERRPHRDRRRQDPARVRLERS